MQLGLIRALDTLLADEGGAGIGSAIDAGQVGFADGTYIPQCMDREVCIAIGASLAGLDVQALELKPADCESRNVLIGHAQTYRHAVEGTARANRFLPLVDVFRANKVEFDEPVQRGLEVWDFLGDELELVGRLITCDHLAVTV